MSLQNVILENLKIKIIRNWTEMNITSPGSILVDYCHFREERAERNLKDAM